MKLSEKLIELRKANAKNILQSAKKYAIMKAGSLPSDRPAPKCHSNTVKGKHDT